MDYQATEKLKINAGITYNKAEDSWDWDFNERSVMTREDTNDITDPLSDAVNPTGAYSPVNYDTWTQNNKIDEYSDLSYEQYQLTLGGKYHFTETFYSNASFNYDIFKAKEDYVYGDEDGEAYYGYVGLGWTF